MFKMFLTYVRYYVRIYVRTVFSNPVPGGTPSLTTTALGVESGVFN